MSLSLTIFILFRVVDLIHARQQLLASLAFLLVKPHHLVPLAPSNEKHSTPPPQRRGNCFSEKHSTVFVLIVCLALKHFSVAHRIRCSGDFSTHFRAQLAHRKGIGSINSCSLLCKQPIASARLRQQKNFAENRISCATLSFAIISSEILTPRCCLRYFQLFTVFYWGKPWEKEKARSENANI